MVVEPGTGSGLHFTILNRARVAPQFAPSSPNHSMPGFPESSSTTIFLMTDLPLPCTIRTSVKPRSMEMSINSLSTARASRGWK